VMRSRHATFAQRAMPPLQSGRTFRHGHAR
jgi:hypothetical protein